MQDLTRDMHIILYGRPYNRSDRVQWTLEELGVPYEYRKLDVFGLEHRQTEFQSKYGLTRLPFIEVNGKILFESGAIMLFLAETFRHKMDLLPAAQTEDHRYVLQWLFFALSTLESSIEGLDSGAGPQPFTPFIDVLRFLDHALESRDFVATDRFTVADIALANGLKWFNRETVSNFSNVKRYYETHTLRPAYKRIEAQPEYPKK